MEKCQSNQSEFPPSWTPWSAPLSKKLILTSSKCPRQCLMMPVEAPCLDLTLHVFVLYQITWECKCQIAMKVKARIDSYIQDNPTHLWYEGQTYLWSCSWYSDFTLGIERSQASPCGRAHPIWGTNSANSSFLRYPKQGSLLFSKFEFSIKPDLRGLSFS